MQKMTWSQLSRSVSWESQKVKWPTFKELEDAMRAEDYTAVLIWYRFCSSPHKEELPVAGAVSRAIAEIKGTNGQLVYNPVAGGI